MNKFSIKFAWLLLMISSSAGAALEYRTVNGSGGVPLQVVEAGPRSAPGVLFIHGATMSSNSWLLQLESSLAKKFHLVAFDLRGHGNSGKPWDSDSYADSQIWADDVAAVMAATGLERPVIVAWSYGGHVTMDYLRHYSAETVAGVIFVGSTGGMLPFPPPDAETAAEFVRLGKLAASPDSGDRLAAAQGFVNGMVVAPVAPELLDREVAAVLAVTPLIRSAMQGRSLDNSDLTDKLTMPVLFIIGDHERTTTPQDIEKLSSSLKQSRYSVYPDTGHMPFLERPESFDAELLQFLDEFN